MGKNISNSLLCACSWHYSFFSTQLFQAYPHQPHLLTVCIGSKAGCSKNGEGNRSDNKAMVSVVLPAYNEADKLEGAVTKISQALKETGYRYEIIIAEDGSTDGTAERAEELAQKFPYVKHIHREKRLGRGTALNNAFRQCSGEVLVYMDLDLATDLKSLKPLVDAITVEGYDLSTGSRMLPESKVERSLRRRLAQKVTTSSFGTCSAPKSRITSVVLKPSKGNRLCSYLAR